MAHVVGVPKRDPCQKCGLPVFLAERLTVAKRVYHRTCLKCARCGFQLTPGSFYETETDGEYCCETCPDEETSMEIEAQAVLRNPSSDSYETEIANKSKGNVRSSIADRLAFFEASKEKSASSSNSSKVLQKSLSDEEKTKSLKKINDETTSPYKMNAALSSFMNATLDDMDGGGDDTNDISIKSGLMDTSESLASGSESEDEEDESEQKPPALPTSLPPDESLEKENEPKLNEDGIKNLKTEIKLESVKNQEEPHIVAALKTAETDKINNTSIYAEGNSNNNMKNNVEEDESLSHTFISTKEQADDLILSKSKSNFVTKDNTEPDKQMRTTNATIVVESTTLTLPPEEKSAAGPADVAVEHELQQELEQKPENEQNEKPLLRPRPLTLDIKTNCNSDMTAAHEDAETTNRLSVVRARLHQFEVIANNKNINDNLINKTPENSSSVNNSSNKSDSVKTIAKNVHLDEDEIKEEIVTDTQETPAFVDESMKLMEIDEVPKNDKGTEVELEIENKTETVSIQETNVTTDTDNISKPNPETNAITNEENVESTQGSRKKIIPIDIPMNDDDEKEKTNKTELKQQQTARPDEKLEKDKILLNKEEPKPFISPAKVNLELYPEELNPFKSDDEDDDVAPLPGNTSAKPVTPLPRKSMNASISSLENSGKKEDKDRSLNPFDSSDDEVEVEKKVKPPRPPPPKISKNPFGSESEEGGDENSMNANNSSKKVPVPLPRTNLSQNPTPEPTPRLSSKQSNHYISPLNNSGDFYGSNSSLGSTPYSLQRNTDGRGSNNSLTSSTGTIRSRKSRKAPAPPPPVKELFPSTEALDSKKSSPSSSSSATPNQGRKKRPAPAPPKPARLLDPAVVLHSKIDNSNDTGPKNSLSYPLQSDLDKLSDEEKALLEGNHLEEPSELIIHKSEGGGRNTVQKLVPLDISIVSDSEDLIKQKEEDNVVYRRTIVPMNIVTPTHEEPIIYDRQLEKMKDNKEAQNRNRQSQLSSGAEDTEPLYNKSSHGKWKRRKGPAPALPIPPRKVLQMLPLQEIRHELDIIEVQQQGLEKQGVILEKMIRDRCEGQNGELDNSVSEKSGPAGQPQNSKEVEDLILQLFELVNEKNELFRRQAELMYLRRQHRLEQEQADLEYEIRVLMAQPERNKTDTDKAREEALIARMLEVVQLRNEVVECLEMDRLREAEEDLSIKQRLELHTANREQETNRHTLSKLSKKEKKKQKEIKKLEKSKKLDADKDADESELSVDKQKTKKKRKKFLF